MSNHDHDGTLDLQEARVSKPYLFTSEFPSTVPPAVVAAVDLPNIERRFVTAGKATFTVSSPKGGRYTYRVSKREDPGKAPMFFVGLLTGPNNETDYQYLGVLDVERGIVRLTKASKYTAESLPYKVILWAIGKLWAGVALPAGYAVQHAGTCGRCGRTLTVPESIASGFGPECIGKV